MRVRFAHVAALVALGTAAFAQERAPRGTATASLNGKTVTLDYGRPSLKGRTLADLMKQLPEDRMWRAGVDQVTTLKTEGPLLVGDKKVAAGTYTVYVHLAENGDRHLVLNTDKGVALKTIFPKAPPELADAPWPHIGDYTKAIAGKEVARVAMKKEAAKEPVDMFTIGLAPGKEAATLNLAWGEESWSLDVKAAK
jgi:Protein of unknown function (DUF2911)